MRIARPRSTHWLAAPIVAALCLSLAACGNDGDDRNQSRAGAEAHLDPASELPAPDGAAGSVTGMPDSPGPGTTPIVRGSDTATGDAAMTIESSIAVDEATPVEGVFELKAPPLLPGPPTPPAPPAPQPPAEPRAAYVQPAEGTTRAPPAGTEAATESTTIVVPADTED